MRRWVLAMLLAGCWGTAFAADPGELFPDVAWDDQRDRLGVDTRRVPAPPPAPRTPESAPTSPASGEGAAPPSSAPAADRPPDRDLIPAAIRTAESERTRRRRRAQRTQLFVPLTREQEVRIYNELYLAEARKAAATDSPADDLALANTLLRGAAAITDRRGLRDYMLMRAFAFAVGARGGSDLAERIYAELRRRLPQDTVAGWLARARLSDQLYDRFRRDRVSPPRRQAMAAHTAHSHVELAVRLARAGQLEPARDYLEAAGRFTSDADRRDLTERVGRLADAVANRIDARDTLRALHAAYDAERSEANARALAAFYIGRLRNLTAARPYMLASDDESMIAAAQVCDSDRPVDRFELAERLRQLAGTLQDDELVTGFSAVAIQAYEAFLAKTPSQDTRALKARLSISLLKRNGPFEDALDLVSSTASPAGQRSGSADSRT